MDTIKIQMTTDIKDFLKEGCCRIFSDGSEYYFMPLIFYKDKDDNWHIEDIPILQDMGFLMFDKLKDRQEIIKLKSQIHDLETND